MSHHMKRSETRNFTLRFKLRQTRQKHGFILCIIWHHLKTQTYTIRFNKDTDKQCEDTELHYWIQKLENIMKTRIYAFQFTSID